jgi:hypothetical protein
MDLANDMATSPTQQKTTNKIILGEKITEARQIIDLNCVREDLPKLIKAKTVATALVGNCAADYCREARRQD